MSSRPWAHAFASVSLGRSGFHSIPSGVVSAAIGPVSDSISGPRVGNASGPVSVVPVVSPTSGRHGRLSKPTRRGGQDIPPFEQQRRQRCRCWLPAGQPCQHQYSVCLRRQLCRLSSSCHPPLISGSLASLKRVPGPAWDCHHPGRGKAKILVLRHFGPLAIFRRNYAISSAHVQR